MNQQTADNMKRLSVDIRIWTVRAIGYAGFGHIGGSASIADVLAVLYGGVMRIDPENPKWENRDWLVLSKGHCAPALYAALALRGFFPMDWLKTINRPGTRLPSHADSQKVPGVDISTGSIGQGMSSAVGVAMGERLQQRCSTVYCILGDGECNEGEIWEGAETAAHLHLDNLVVFVDWNKKQLDGPLEEICKPLDLAEKFRAFGFETRTIAGNDTAAIWQGIEAAKAVTGKPHCIILDTVKGSGIDFAEKEAFNHYMTFGIEQAEAAVKEIERRYAEGDYPGGTHNGKN